MVNALLGVNPTTRLPLKAKKYLPSIPGLNITCLRHTAAWGRTVLAMASALVLFQVLVFGPILCNVNRIHDRT